MSSAAHVHDSAFKVAMKEKAVAKDLLQQHLPKNMSERIDFDTLEGQPTSFLDEQLNSTHADILYKADIDGEEGYIYILCEHQSTPDRLMPIRIWNYTCRIIEEDFRQYGRAFPVVLPVLVYNGKPSPYPYSAYFFDYFAQPRLAQETMFQSFNLVDLNCVPDEDILERPWASVIQMLLKYYRDQRLLSKIFQISDAGIVDYQIEHDGRHLLVKMLYYVLNSPKLGNKRLAVKMMSEKSDNLGEIGMSLLQMERIEGKREGKGLGIRVGYQRGKLDGIEQGIEQVNLRLVSKMLNQGLSDTDILDLLALSFDQLQALKKKIH